MKTLNPLIRFVRKLGMLFGRRRFRDELGEEMAFHRAQAERDLIAEGMTPEAARTAVMRRFGNATRVSERSHEEVRFSLETVAQDLHFALRQLRKNPAFALTAVLILALGIAASVSIFAFVDAALIKPLPYSDPTRLVHVTEKESIIPLVNLSYPDFADWKRLNTVFSSFDAFTGNQYALATASGAEAVPAANVSTGFFRTLGIKPALGRDFNAGEDAANAPGVVMLAYGAWQRRFGGRSDIVGQSLTLSGDAYTIIGVLPRPFQFAPAGSAELWTALQPVGGCQTRRDCHSLYAVARLKDGVSVAAARAQMEGIARQLEMQYPDSNRGRGASVVALSEFVVGKIRPILLVLLSGAGLLLFIACINVASLLLVRSESRRREIAVRGALGASSARLRSQFAIEAIALAVGGCVIGLAFALGGMRVLSLLLSDDMKASMPFLTGIGMNAHVLLFAAAVAALASLLFAFMPMRRFRGLDLREGLAAGARGSTGTLWRRLGSNLVVIELATAVVLLTGAGLLGKSLYRLLHVDLGFASDHLATMNIGLPDRAFQKDDQTIQFERQLIERINSLPGVQSSAVTTTLPVRCTCNTDWIRIAGKPYNGIHLTVLSRLVSAGYFATLQARLLSGRYFSDAEDESKPKIAVVNRAFADKFFPGEDAVGKRFGDTELTPKSMVQIVGVVDNFKDGALDEETWPAVYEPFNQVAPTYFSVVVRTAQNEEAMLPSIQAAIHGLNRDVGLERATSMTASIAASETAYLHRATACLVGSFAAMALLLGVAGIYGIVAYSVSQRTREIGVRMALGAQRGSVYALVLRQAARLVVSGIALGIVGSVAAALPARKLLFGVAAWDAPTLAAVAFVLAASAMLASYLPARRAASVSPSEALRAE